MVPSFCRLELPQPSYRSIKTLQAFYEMRFLHQVSNGFYGKFQHVPLCRVFTNWVTYRENSILLAAT